MAKHRYINTGFWDDYYVSQLDPSEKLLFLYLITNPNTSMLGVYQIPLKKIALDTGFDLEMIKKLMQRFADDGKAFYEMGYVVVKNWLKNQNVKSPKIQTSLKRELEELPIWLQKRLLSQKDTLSIPYTYPIDTNAHEEEERERDEEEERDEVSTDVDTASPAKFEDGSLDPRNQQVQQVVEHFEKQIGKMPRATYQRRAAKTLIQRHGFEKTIGGINAIAASRGEQFAPTISSLEALRDRWIDLETFYQRTMSKSRGVTV